MDPIVIDTRELYDYARSRGYEPLTEKRFVLDERADEEGTFTYAVKNRFKKK